jgi:hypothetical protein
MKVILSRKGFDTSYGGFPSFILPDNTLLSLPIPSDDTTRYSDIKTVDGVSYFNLIRNVKPKIKFGGKFKWLTHQSKCHLDPDLREESITRPKGWRPLFGQVNAAQSHLENHNVKKDDIFLFFGLFRRVKMINAKLSFDSDSSPIHIIYGYLQIGKKYKITLNSRFPAKLEYHPHLQKKYRMQSNNAIYEACDWLTLNPDFPGAGVFHYHPSLVLTKPGYKSSRWSLPEIFKGLKISYHHNTKSYGWRDNIFYSALRGQEFVIEENVSVSKWVKGLIESNLRRW